jgi:hypothetical protein
MKQNFRKIVTALYAVLFSLGLIAQPAGITSKGSKTPSFDLSKSGPVLFNQMDDPGTAFMSSFHYTNADMETMTCAAADDFRVPEGETWEVHSFGVLGSYFANMPGGGDTLNVFILADNDGKPGDTLYSYWAYTNFEKQEILVEGNNGNTYLNTYFEIILPSVITLNAGDYWLSVQMYANANITGKWGWKEEYYTSAINGAEWHWVNPLNGSGYGYTDWTPASVVVGPWLTWELSFAVFGVPKANDLSVKEITSPDEYYYGIPTDEKPVTVIIKNEGTSDQTGFDLKYDFNGSEVVENIGNVTLAYNETYTYTFNKKVDLSTPGNYVLKVSTVLAGDENTDNDLKTLNIFVFDPTIYTMPSGGASSSITACSGTFTDAGGLEGDLVKGDEGVLTIYPVNTGDKTRLKFIEFDIGWSDFWIYDGEDETAKLIGFWEDTLSPGTITASYQNTTGALTVRFKAQAWTPFEKPGWSANISCYTPVENNFEVLKVEVGKPAVFASDYVPVYAYIKNIGTDIRDKEVTFKSNGQTFATVVSDSVMQSDTMVVEAIWHPLTEGDYELEVSIPDDNGMEDDNQAGVNKYVYPIDFFYEGFEEKIFPPEEWGQSGFLWQRKTAWPAVGDAHAYISAPYGMLDTLVTPLLSISDTGVLDFMAFSSAWWPGELDIIWIDGTTGESHFIQNVSLPFMWYSSFEIDVSAAQGNNYLGFVGKYNPNGGSGEVKVDEVWGDGVTKFFYENDLKANQLTANSTPVEGESVTISAVIKNIGSNPVSGSDYTVKLMREPGVELASVPGQDIDAKQFITYSIDYAFQYPGKYDCYIEVDYADDQHPENNATTYMSIYVQQAGTEQVEIGSDENYTTTWFYPITTMSSGYYVQSLYYASEIGDPKAITGIMFYYSDEEHYPIENVPVEMWFSETNETDMSGSLEAANNYQKVFSGTVKYLPGEHGIFIPLDYVYNYQGGNLVVTTYKPAYTDFLGTSFMRITPSDDVRVRYYSGYNYDIDPYDQSLLDEIPENQQRKEKNFPNAKFFKYDLNGQYCVPQTVYGTVNGDYIDGVTFNEINNINTGATGGPAYNDYLTMSTNVERGRTYELTIDAKFAAGGSVSAWIDFNGNKKLDDEGERVVHLKTDELTHQFKALVTIPDTANLGVTILRVRNSDQQKQYASCEAVDHGETEDYSLNIVETEQVYNPVNTFGVDIDTQGNVDLNWDVPYNPGIAHVEGFEMNAWPPQGWEIKQSIALDGQLTDPSGTTWSHCEMHPEYVYDGAYSAVLADSADNYNWLITPDLLIYGNDGLSFMIHYTADQNISSKFYVMVYADGNWEEVLHLDDANATTNHYGKPLEVDISQFAGKSVKIAFVAENTGDNPVAIDDLVLNGIPVDGKGVSALAGYEIYKNGTLLTTINDTWVTTLTDQVNVTENYKYCIKALYSDGNVSDALCDSKFYLEALTPPLDVSASVDNNDVTVKWLAPNNGIVRFFDDFETYTAGEQLACQNPDDWTTWLGQPCSDADPLVSDANAYNGSQSVVITDLADLLHKNETIYTEGKYSVHMRIYIPAGYNAYFNVLQEHNLNQGSHWGMQVFFDVNGEGIVDGGGAGSATFNYEYDKWLYNNVVIDLDNDTAFYYINDKLIHSWKWSTGINGAQASNTFHGADFYAWNSNNTSFYYLDDFGITQLYNYDCSLDYNVYKDGTLMITTSDTEIMDNSAQPGFHEYCVEAIYDEGVSDQVCDHVDMFSAPENFTVELQNENDVLCKWDPVVSSTVDGYYVYRDGKKVSGLVTDVQWTDMNVEGGTHVYYVTTSFGGVESLPSINAEIVILIRPKNLMAEESGNDIVLEWTGVGDVHSGEMVELFQHDGVAVNGNYQWFNIGYGVVFDLSQYPDATLEMVDFYHQSWDISGNWLYKFHIVDWNTKTEIAVVGPFQTTGDDQWEFEIPLGSVSSTSTLIGVFMEPMSHDPSDAYPVLGFDAQLNGYSIQVSLNDYTQYEAVGGDFLLDLWIWDSFTQEMVKPQMITVDNAGLKNTRLPYKPVNGEFEMNQQINGGKVLTGYNVYYSFDSDPFTKLETVADTTYVHAGAATQQGTHAYFITSQYEEGESQPSDTAIVIATRIGELGDDEFAVYPNPAIDEINIESDSKINTIILLNVTGQQVVKIDKVNNDHYILNMSNYQPGVYFLRINKDGKWINKKVVKE